MSPARVAPRMAGSARRRHLLSVARQRFAEDGYHVATTSSIAREAGVSEPLLFKHFGSKEELFRLRFRAATQELESPALVKSLRRDIARMKTILRERELNHG